MAGRYFNRQGGVSRCMAELAARAAREGHEVTVFAHEALDRAGVDARFASVGMLRRPSWLQIPSFSLALRRSLRPRAFDVVHAQGPQALGADVYTAHSCHAAFLARRRREAGLRGALSHAYPPHVVALHWERRCFGSGAVVIAVSERVKTELRDSLGLPEESIRVIYNGVDTRAFAPAASRQAARAALGGRRPPAADGDAVLLFIGWEFRRKGLANVIRALAGVQGASLWAVGGDDPAPYRRLAADLGVADRVHFAGHQQNAVGWLQAADALVFPTTYEPFGLVILEALACGTPVITSRLAGAAELIADGEQGLLLDDPNDARELRDKLQRFLADRELWPALGSAARRVAERCDWDAVWSETSALYREVAAERRHSG
jgi:UDP-glucose:(heptosyl)LPS alpha-1,3-glucosyltransferase